MFKLSKIFSKKPKTHPASPKNKISYQSSRSQGLPNSYRGLSDNYTKLYLISNVKT